jgi:steroid delta-isomerase
MGTELARFLERHLATFNEAVRSGDFAPLVALFANDAELAFEGVPVGPFRGREAIAAAYAAQPPSDTMTIVDTRVDDDGTVVEGFSWTADAGVRSGEMRITVEAGRIRRLVVSFAPS